MSKVWPQNSQTDNYPVFKPRPSAKGSTTFLNCFSISCDKTGSTEQQPATRRLAEALRSVTIRSMAVAARIQIQTSSSCPKSKEHILRWDVHLPKNSIYLISPKLYPPSVLKQRGLVVGIFGEALGTDLSARHVGMPGKVERF